MNRIKLLFNADASHMGPLIRVSRAFQKKICDFLVPVQIYVKILIL
jgi:hypothetical protein